MKSNNPSCEILEVTHDYHIDRINITQIDVQDLVNKIKESEKQQKILTQELSRVVSRRRLVQAFADTAMSSRGRTSESNLCLADAKEILNYHRDEMIELDTAEMELQEKIAALKESITLLEGELRKTKTSNSKETFEKTRSVTILVNVKSMEEMQLMLSYVVTNATWTPSYDLRIDTIRNVMDLTYFAEVTQKSGEDWTECAVCLSTSNPAIGSSPPPLPTRTIDWSYNCSNADPLIRGRKFKTGNMAYTSTFRHSGSDSSDDEIASVSMIEDQLKPYEKSVPTAPPLPQNSDLGVSGNDAGSTTFVIPRKVTIESDNKPHKVTVTITSFSPQMVHYVSASLSAFVYLQAKTQNTSLYPLLPSDKVAVFLDGNFMTTTSIKQTSPGEFFNVFLGVDPSIKVQYMPCRTNQYVKGWLSGTEVKKYFYSTVVHNTKQRPIRIIIAEVFPRSADEKISIELLDPPPASLTKASSDTAPIMNEQDVIAALDGFGSGGAEPTTQGGTPRATPSWPRDFVTQNKFTNNIVWLKTLQPGEKTEVKFSYRVAWPQGQSIGIR